MIIHDFLAQAQASYLTKLKETVEEGVLIVCLDFAENFTCKIQDSIQSSYWSNTQVTLHPYVIYYRNNNKLKHLSLVAVSEHLKHNHCSVNLFNEKMIEFSKRKIGSENIKKIIYFSDGSGAQYKNKYNFVNLIEHENEFGVKAEWNFFATGHGKGACDGIGGTVKRRAYQTSLQRINTQPINSAKALAEWAQTAFKKIEFVYCSKEEHTLHEKNLKLRYSNAKPITNTRKYHSYAPLNKNQMICKIYSEDLKYVVQTCYNA